MRQYTQISGWYTQRGERYVTTRHLPWELGKPGSRCLVVVPPTFVFDVSVPEWATWAFDRSEERFLKAACLHDWLLFQGWDRLTAGAVFGAALKADGVRSWRRLVMWLAVSLYKWE